MTAYSGSFRHSPGCACCEPIETCVLARGCCNVMLEGATVTIYRGESEIDGGVTDADGEWCTTEAESGDAVTIEPPEGYDYATVEGGALNVGFNNAFTLGPAEGFRCGCGGKPLPDDLTLNDSIGDIPLVWHDSTPYGGGWVGCVSRTASALCVSDRSCLFPAASPYPVGVTMGLHVGVACEGPGGLAWVVTLIFPMVRKYGGFGGGWNRWLDGDATCSDFAADLAAGFPIVHEGGLHGCTWDIWTPSTLLLFDASPSCDPLALESSALLLAGCYSPTVQNNGYGIYSGTTSFTLTE
jgi:hypothetical protein